MLVTVANLWFKLTSMHWRWAGFYVIFCINKRRWSKYPHAPIFFLYVLSLSQLNSNRIYVLFLQSSVHEQNHQPTHSSISWVDVPSIASYEFKQNQMHSKGQFQGPSLCQLIVSFHDHIQGIPSQNVFFKRAKNVRKSICR